MDRNEIIELIDKEEPEIGRVFEKYTRLDRTTGKGQYSGVGIDWVHLDFSENFLNYLSDNRDKVTESIGFMPSGINVTVYRLFGSDITRAKWGRGKKPAWIDKPLKGTKFNEMIKRDPNYTDFDGDSGNFHKKPNDLWQIVFVEKGKDKGPAYKFEASNAIGAIYKKAYTPEINFETEDDEEYSLDELLERAFDKIIFW